MPLFKILSKEEIKEFDTPTEFTLSEKEKHFTMHHQINDIVENLPQLKNKVIFIILYGYFKVHKKFISVEKFYKGDIKYILSLLTGDENKKLTFASYSQSSIWRYKKLIADIFGHSLFAEFDKDIIESKIIPQVKQQIRPRQIFTSLLEILDKSKVEIPIYTSLHTLIVKCYNDNEECILSKLESLLDKEDELISKLDQLIENDETTPHPETSNLEASIQDKISLTSKRYQITLLKKPNYSTKPGKIRDGIEDLATIKELYDQVGNIAHQLDLTEGAIRHYAIWTSKALVTQLIQFRNKYKRYLYLISFITYQYYFRQDLFVDFFLQAVQSCQNGVKSLEKSKYFDDKKERDEAIKIAYQSSKSLKFLIDEIKKILDSTALSSDEKVAKTKEILAANIDKIYSHKSSKSFDEIINILELEISSKIQDADYYNLLAERSIKLQNRVGAILKFLEFDLDSSNNKLMEAIGYYKMRDGDITKKSPTGFLNPEEREVLNKGDKFNVSLYKTLLFIKVADGIKSGDLSLKYSNRYLAIDQYLINKEAWNNNKEDFLKKAGIENFADFTNTIDSLKKLLDSQYNEVNINALSGKNKYIKFDKNNKVIIATPKVEKEDILSEDEATSIFPKDAYYPILQVLEDINKATNFVSTFEHYNIKYAKSKPPSEVFYGGIMGHGFDLGSDKIAKISKGINASTLSNTINWYFTLDNLYSANNLLTRFIHKVSLSDLFQKHPDKLHTASDGQKFDLSVDSIDANYSFKYHGKGKGISVYSFTDEKNALFYSTAFSSSEREAAYVLDGLLHNDEINSDIHSTDTHGYTEIIFAATHMSGIFFAPRIRNLKTQKLYSFHDKKIKHYKDKGYKIIPSEYIDIKIIEENWDDILRIIASIKLKHSTASQIFKRLSSYARQNPLYKALKEFGRIIKSLFILKYYDDVELRQSIEKQLNLVELSHKFAKAIFFGNNQEFNVQSKEEQEIIVNCRRLIQNAIILWNYLYISDLLIKTKDIKKQKAILEVVQMKSMIWWRHMNLYGEYDFTIIAKFRNIFDMERILSFNVGDALKAVE